MSELTLSVKLTADGSGLTGTVRVATADAERLSAALRGTGTAGDAAASGLTKTGASADKARKDLDEADNSSKKLRGGLQSLSQVAGQALAFLGIQQGASALLKAASEAESLHNRLQVLTGSSQGAAAAQEYLRDTADRLGGDISTLGSNYARLLTLQQSGLTTQQESKDLLEGMAAAGAALGASNGQIETSMYGLSQALASGTVRAEELNQVMEPMGDLLQRTAAHAGVNAGEFRQLVNSGQMTSEMFKTHLIAALKSYGAAAEANADSTAANLNRIGNAWNGFAGSLSGEASTIIGGVAIALEWLFGVMASPAGQALFAGVLTTVLGALTLKAYGLAAGLIATKVAAVAAAGGVGLLQGALTLLGGPWMLLIGGAVALATLIMNVGDNADDATPKVAVFAGAAEQAADKLPQIESAALKALTGMHLFEDSVNVAMRALQGFSAARLEKEIGAVEFALMDAKAALNAAFTSDAQSSAQARIAELESLLLRMRGQLAGVKKDAEDHSALLEFSKALEKKLEKTGENLTADARARAELVLLRDANDAMALSVIKSANELDAKTEADKRQKEAIAAAREAASTQAKVLQDTRDAVDPLATATRAYEKDLRDLEAAIKKNNVQDAEAATLKETLRQKYQEQLNPAAAVLKAIRDETVALKQSDEEREIAKALVAAHTTAVSAEGREIAKAVTEKAAQKHALEEEARVREAAKAATTGQIATLEAELQKLTAENALIAAGRTEREAEILTRAIASGATAEQIAAIESLLSKLDAEGDKRDLLTGKNKDYNASVEDSRKQWLSTAEDIGDALVGAFGAAGKSVGDMVEQLGTLQEAMWRIEDERQKALKTETSAGGIERINATAREANARAQVRFYADMAGSAKNFFKENSTGYKVMEGVEKAFRIFELAQATASFTKKLLMTETLAATQATGIATVTAAQTASVGPEVAATMAKGQAAAMTAVATQGSGDPYTAWPRIAGMIALMAAVGFAVSGSGGNTPDFAKERQENAGTGTVFGDVKAKSESIYKSIEHMEKYAAIGVSHGQGMLRALRNIEQAMTGLTSIVLRSGWKLDKDGISGFRSDKSTSTAVQLLGGGVLGMALDKLTGGIIGKAIGKLFGTKTKVLDGGFFAGAQNLADIERGGFQASAYETVESKKKRLGITTSTRVSENLSAAPAEITNQFGLVIKNIASGVREGAALLGASGAEFEKRLSGFVVDIGHVSLKDLKGEQIQEQFAAIFGAVGDKMAQAALPGLEKFQKVGEGYFETMARVAAEVGALDAVLTQIGVDVRAAFGAVGIASLDAKMQLIEFSGGIEQLAGRLSTYYEKFYSDDERNARTRDDLNAKLAAMGVSVGGTLTDFRKAVEAQDLATETGRRNYAALMELAGPFAELIEKLGDGAKGVTFGVADASTEAMRAAAADWWKGYGATVESQEDLQARMADSLVDVVEGNTALLDSAAAAQQLSETHNIRLLAKFDELGERLSTAIAAPGQTPPFDPRVDLPVLQDKFWAGERERADRVVAALDQLRADLRADRDEQSNVIDLSNRRAETALGNVADKLSRIADEARTTNVNQTTVVR